MGATGFLFVMILGLAVPLIPDGDEARRWAEEELAQDMYADAKPTWFDYFVQDVVDFFNGLFSPDAGAQNGSWATVVIVIVLLAALIVALILWGRPRASARRPQPRKDLLGEADDRTAAQLRAEAESNAREGNWDAATILRFRALARSLLERDIIDPAPGATAQAIARETAKVLMSEAAALRDAAGFFDDVRYLELPSSAEKYGILRETDERLTRLSPQEEPVQQGANA